VGTTGRTFSYATDVDGAFGRAALSGVTGVATQGGSALFNEIAFIFWETSYAKDGHYMNLWIGPEERQYVHAMQDFAEGLYRDVRPAAVHLDGPQAREVRAYGLRGEKSGGVYLHHYGCAECRKLSGAGQHAAHRWDHDRGEVRGLKVTIEVAKATKGYWYRPTDAAILARLDVPAGRQTLTAPPFSVDLALLLTDRGAPDSDRDGKPNDVDDDDDNDGVPDVKDAFPLEREEWADADGDRIGPEFLGAFLDLRRRHLRHVRNVARASRKRQLACQIWHGQLRRMGREPGAVC
jgi:hypothetical protein